MKRLSLGIFIILFVVSGAVAAKSKLVFEKTEIDFGETDPGKVLDVEFKFVNVGDETLIIKKINSTCGCTVPKLLKKEYKPGEKGVLPVKYNSRGHNGNVVKAITVDSSDEDNPHITLKIKGNVVLKDFARAEISTREVEFKEVSIGKEYTQKISIKNTGTIELLVIEITHSPELHLVFDKITVMPGSEINVKIVYTPLAVGRFANFIRFRTNTYQRTTSIVKVTANVNK